MSAIVFQSSILTYKGEPLTVEDGVDTLLTGSGVFIPQSSGLFSDAGFNSGNLLIAFQLQPIKSYKPGRNINPLASLTKNVPVFLKMKAPANIVNS